MIKFIKTWWPMILGTLIFFDIFGWVYVNMEEFSDIFLFSIHEDNEVRTGLLILSVAVYSALGMFFIMLNNQLLLKKELKKKERYSERKGIEHQESADRLKILESKIDTLEEALKQALKDKE